MTEPLEEKDCRQGKMMPKTTYRRVCNCETISSDARRTIGYHHSHTCSMYSGDIHPATLYCHIVQWDIGRYKGYWLCTTSARGESQPIRKLRKPEIDVFFAQSFIDPFIQHIPCWKLTS